MSDERTKRNLKEKFGLILIKEVGFEPKTVAPMKLVDLENSKLQQPSDINVKSKKKCNPDKDTWEDYPVIDVLLEGKLNIFYSLSITKE